MAVKYLRYIVLGERRSAYARALGFGVCHAGLDTRADDTQLKLGKHVGHLNKGVCHGVKLALGAIHRDTANDDKTQFLHSHALYNLAQLLGASRKSRHFKRDDGSLSS